MVSAASSVGTAIRAWVGTPELLARVDDLGLLAGPAGEEVGLRSRRLDRLDVLQAGRGDALQTAVSETTRRLTSARWRETARSARRLASAKTTVSDVSSRS